MMVVVPTRPLYAHACAQWNPFATSPSISLQQNNLYVTGLNGTGPYGAHADKSKSAGKYYWENYVTGANDVGLGLDKPGNSVNQGLGVAVNSYAYKSDGTKMTGNTALGYGASYTVGDLISVIWDADAGTLTFWKNGVSQGTAFTGLAGMTLLPAVSITFNDKVQTNFGEQGSAYAPPSGFGNVA